MASRKPAPAQASVRELRVRLRHRLGRLQDHRALRRITAALHWVLRDPGLAAADLLFRPGRPVRRLGTAVPPPRRLEALIPTPAVDSVRRAELAEQRRMERAERAL